MSEINFDIYRLDMPSCQFIPLVLDSPHSGSIYPEIFDTIVPIHVLKKAEDMHVSELFGNGPKYGAPLLSALFPRSFVDPNRSVSDIDRELLMEAWPEPLHPSEKARLGHGLIWRICPPNHQMYDRRLSVNEVKARIESYWQPYHRVLEDCLDQVVMQFGMVWHLNCHSMPSSNSPSIYDASNSRWVDFVLGDRDGTTCDHEFTTVVSSTLQEFGYRVRINDPYKGMEIVKRFGKPVRGRNSLQIEINRALYINEETLELTDNYKILKTHISQLIEIIGEYTLSCLRGKAAE